MRLRMHKKIRTLIRQGSRRTCDLDGEVFHQFAYPLCKGDIARRSAQARGGGPWRERRGLAGRASCASFTRFGSGQGPRIQRCRTVVKTHQSGSGYGVGQRAECLIRVVDGLGPSRCARCARNGSRVPRAAPGAAADEAGFTLPPHCAPSTPACWSCAPRPRLRCRAPDA